MQFKSRLTSEDKRRQMQSVAGRILAGEQHGQSWSAENVESRLRAQVQAEIKLGKRVNKEGYIE